MQTSKQSPKAKLRSSIFASYRARKHRLSNLWLVYSPKTDSDWVISSDRQLIYWLVVLEADPSIVDFVIADKGSATSRSEPAHLATVQLASGVTEMHFTSEPEDPGHAQYKVFSPMDLTAKARLSVRWMKAISFAAAIRQQELSVQTMGILSEVTRLGSGTIGALVSSFPNIQVDILIGLIVRISAAGTIRLDLTDNSISYSTRWEKYEPKTKVE
ncbi:MAG: hypothetical protein KYX62_02715 [Pseudomonadota bacterium]|nr:hypothetical protein [Pseudomonadota bacterium]